MSELEFKTHMIYIEFAHVYNMLPARHFFHSGKELNPYIDKTRPEYSNGLFGKGGGAKIVAQNCDLIWVLNSLEVSACPNRNWFMFFCDPVISTVCYIVC
jgi:hypothetical protein